MQRLNFIAYNITETLQLEVLPLSSWHLLRSSGPVWKCKAQWSFYVKCKNKILLTQSLKKQTLIRFSPWLDKTHQCTFTWQFLWIKNCVCALENNTWMWRNVFLAVFWAWNLINPEKKKRDLQKKIQQLTQNKNVKESKWKESQSHGKSNCIH